MPYSPVKRNFHSEIAKSILLLILLASIPICLILGFKDIILGIIIYLQLLVIWYQAEITERQNTLLVTQYEPSFSVSEGRESTPGMTPIYIINVSQNPAYNVMVARVLEEGKPIPPKEWKENLELTEEEFIQCLSPGENAILFYFIPPSAFNNFVGKEIEVSYTNKVGQNKSIFIIPLPYQTFMVVHPTQELPGILHKLFENLGVWNEARYLKKYLKKEELKR